ncbi:hypothetical protein KQI42_12810 [Tissierella sp. MSJ-40]|uniref:Uncharacterized protein n=1 Tax=Tissierella simiarum TaxID=2841534 RepID=A0ABS6E7L2_9FIRM|nr:hypothetical protein [Tissierella simiarum]MBU5438900.1 hypothetical protein [Tissierella simiarum]
MAGDILMEGIDKLFEDLKVKHLSFWWNTKPEFPKLQEKVSFSDKLRNEKKIERFRKGLFKTLQQIPKGKEKEENWRKEVFSLIKDLEFNISGYEDSIIDFFIENGYAKITEEFIKEVKEFDPKMDIYDTFQAIRNVWIMNSIQILYNMKVQLTPSIFSYSMLYPYSDNYLDDPNISLKEKVEFNNKFRKWLLGEEKNPSNINEEHIYSLVKKIEGEFSRVIYPKVFYSLLAIHKAQEQSLIQQKEKTIPYEKDIIGITFEKGGTSVLADAYLVRGDLEEEEADFMFGYGVFLQIIDDLQDIEEDLKNSHMTLFSQLGDKYFLDKIVSKLMNFIDNFFHNETTFLLEDALKLKKVIHACSIIMIFEAVSKNKKRFSRGYIKEIESHSMVRFSYFKKVKKKFQKTFSSEDIINICTILSKSK